MRPEEAFMRNFVISVFSIALLTGVLAAQSDANQQSLGDAARQQRTAKKSAPAKVITNDDLADLHPKDEPTSAATPSSAAKPDSDAKKSPSDAKPTAAKSDAKDKKTDAPPTASETQIEQKYRDDVRKQRTLVAKLEKEIADKEHTVQVQSTNYYMDPGSRLRDPKAWAEQREKINKEMAAKQEKLQEARATLDRLLEEARRLGIPERALE
jgi:hypothetical protein